MSSVTLYFPHGKQASKINSPFKKQVLQKLLTIN